MIVIENADLIQGDATVAAEVDFQIYGLDNNALANLADGQLANSIGTLYTANSTDVVTAIILVNTGAAHNHVNLYHKPTGGTSRRLIPKDLQLESGYALYFEGGKCHVLTAAGGLVETIDTGLFLDDTAGGTDALTTKAITSNAFRDHYVATSGAAAHGIGTMAAETATNYVAKALYDAYTVLMATSNDTPEAITIAAQQVVGRITGGAIKGLSVAELQALLFSLALTENVEIQLTAAPSADGKYSGITEAGTAGYGTTVFGDLVYFQTNDSKWELASADNAAAGCNFKLGIMLSAVAENAACKVLLFGKVNAATAFPTLTIGAPVFMSTTAGDVQVAAPTGTTDIVRIMGYGNTADELFFCPENDWLKLV